MADDSARLMALIILLIPFYIYHAIMLQKVAKKTNAENANWAWIPILNAVLMLRIAKQPMWTLIGFFIPYANYLVVGAVWAEIAGVLNKSKWWGILWLVPILGTLFVPAYLAFSKTSIEVKSENANSVKRPTGITVLAIFLIFGLISNVFLLFGEAPATLFGEVILDGTAQTFYLITAVITAYIVYGFFKLLKSAWTVAMIFYSFGIVNSLINTVSLAQGPQVIIMIFSLLIGIIIVIYIQGKKDYFKN